jgi:hypothetical protein
MRAAIDEAEEESIAACEVCSAPGQLADPKRMDVGEVR